MKKGGQRGAGTPPSLSELLRRAPVRSGTGRGNVLPGTSGFAGLPGKAGGSVPGAAIVVGEKKVDGVLKLMVAFPQALGKDVALEADADAQGHAVAATETRDGAVARVRSTAIPPQDFSTELW